jgi:uncharacterized protein
MQLTPDSQSTRWRITAYSDTSVTAGQQALTRSTVVTAHTLLPWPVARMADLESTHLEPIIELGVDLILLGAHDAPRWPTPEVIGYAAMRRVGLEVMSIGAAARTYNLLLADERPVALALILPG